MTEMARPIEALSVSASQFVRRFGEWREQALAAPVYIRHHGRARFALTTVDFLSALIHRDGAEAGAIARDLLLAAIDAPLIVADADLTIAAMSPPARAMFGRRLTPGMAVAHLVAPPLTTIVTAAAVRVRDGDGSERIEVRDGDRRLELSLHPLVDGVAIAARDRGAEAARALLEAEAIAIADAATAAGDVAILRLNPRGYLVHPCETLARIAGLAHDAMMRVRFPALFDVGSRVAVGDAIEEAMRGATARVDAALLAADGITRPVRIGLSGAPIAAGGDALLAVLAARPPSPTNA